MAAKRDVEGLIVQLALKIARRGNSFGFGNAATECQCGDWFD